MFFNILKSATFPTNLIITIAYVIAILAAIMIHELAHGFVAYKCGDSTAKYDGRLSLNPVKHFDTIGFLLLLFVGFGWAKPVPVNYNNFRKYKKGVILTSLAGVVANFILAFVFFPLAILSRRIIFLDSLMWYLFIVNLSLCVFNLLPVFPLDGFKLIEVFLGSNNRYVQFMYRYGMFVMFGVFLLAGYFLPTLIGWISMPIRWFWGLIL